MKIKKIGEPIIIMSNPYGIHDYFGWPTAVRLQDGRIAVCASGFRLEHICPFGKSVISYSYDEGETYTPPTPIIDTVLDDRDAGICPFGEKSFVFTSFNNTIETQRGWHTERLRIRAADTNVNEEKYMLAYLDTVSPEAEKKFLGSTFRITNDGGVTFSDIYISPITSPHGPCVLSDGSILWVGRIFADNGKENLIQAYKINTDGSMEKVGEIENVFLDDGRRVDFCEPYAIELPDGRMICHIRTEGSVRFSLYQSESSDGGKTWTKAVPILKEYGGAPAHLMLHSSGALISVYGYRAGPYGVKAMISYDLGKTWEKDIEIYTQDISYDLGYPSTVELSDGSLITVFYAIPEKGSPAVVMQQKWTLENNL